ncbi:hypothetical protein [Pseudonocardia pini]|uniref:hypothetical protein n=1 Tax=Pseudonocardia pini TaxID=2758030 RepID=UPI0015F0C569|nr:hypothetical protein [Pseudonocardia pini]
MDGTPRPTRTRSGTSPRASGTTTRCSGVSGTLEGPHRDPLLTPTVGLSRGYDFGSQRISWLAHLVTDWAGDDAEITSLTVRLLAPNLLGDLTRLRGRVTGVAGAGGEDRVVEAEIEAVNQRDVVTATGTVTVRLP